MPDPIPNAPADEELSASDIADLAEVSPSAVSNWRKRYSDFPAPIDSAGRWTRFRGAEVRAWLVANDKLPESAADAMIANCDDLLWAAVEASRSSSGGDPLDSLLKAAAFAATLVALSDQAVRDQIRQLIGQEPTPPKGLEHLASNPPLVVRSYDQIADSLLNAVDRIGSDNRNPYTTTTPSLIERIVAATMPTTGLDFAGELYSSESPEFDWYPASIYDPCAGSGRLVSDVAEEFIDHAPVVVAQEIDPTMAKIAGLVVALREASYEEDPVQIGDSLLVDKFPDLKADLVVAHPPLGMRLPDGLEDDPRWVLGDPGRDGSWAWIQVVLSNLSDRGRAAVVVEPSWAWRGGRFRELRANLIRQNYLDAVIELPPGIFQGTGIGGLLVLLAKDRANRRHPREAGEILFCNSSIPISDGGTADVPFEVLEASYANWRDHDAFFPSFEGLLASAPLFESGGPFADLSAIRTSYDLAQVTAKWAELFRRGEVSVEVQLGLHAAILMSWTSHYERVADNDFDLTPRRYSVSGKLTNPSSFGEVMANVAQKVKASISSTKATATAIQPVRDFYAELQPGQRPAMQMTTLGDLRGAGQIELIAGRGTGRTKKKDDLVADALPQLITAAWVRDASAGNKPSITALVTKSTQIDQEALLQFDDVIFDTSDKTSVWTVTQEEAGSALGVGLYAIRLNSQSPDPVGLTPAFVAMWARTNHLSDQIKRFSIGEGVSKIRMRDLQRIEIPVPADEAAFDWFTRQIDLHADLRTAHEDLSKFVADLPAVEARLLDALIHEPEIAEEERSGV